MRRSSPEKEGLAKAVNEVSISVERRSVDGTARGVARRKEKMILWRRHLGQRGEWRRPAGRAHAMQRVDQGGGMGGTATARGGARNGEPHEQVMSLQGGGV